MSLVDDVAEYLEVLGIASAEAIGRDILPTTPDTALGVYGYGGFEPVYVHSPERFPVAERPGLHIEARGPREDAETPKALIEAAWRALSLPGGTVLSGVRYQYIKPLASPFKLAIDDNGRVKYAANFTTDKELADA